MGTTFFERLKVKVASLELGLDKFIAVFSLTRKESWNWVAFTKPPMEATPPPFHEISNMGGQLETGCAAQGALTAQSGRTCQAHRVELRICYSYFMVNSD
jgi:hypothetical protein